MVDINIKNRLVGTQPVIERGGIERILFNNVCLINEIPRSDPEPLYIETIPTKIKEDLIEIGRCKINVKSCVYRDAESEQILNGWNQLGRKIDLTNLFSLYFMTEMGELNAVFKNNNTGKTFAWIYEPTSSIILRLCYWYWRSIQIGLLKGKEKDVHNKLRIKRNILDILKVVGLASDTVKEKIRQINTTISELIICSLSSELNHKITFKKNHEFLIDGKVVEVKTIHPKLDNTGQLNISENQMRSNMIKDVLINYVKKPEIRDNHLKKAIEKQQGEIIFLNITFALETKLVQWLIELEDRRVDLSFRNALDEALTIASNRHDVVPLVITIGSISFEYEIYAITVELPIKNNGNRSIDF